MVEQLFGYARDELVGVSVDRLVPLAGESSHHRFREQYVASPRTRVMGSGLELHGRKRSGVEFPVEISLSPAESGGRMLVIAVVRDVSDRREAEEELGRARAVLALVDERERIARDLHDTVIQRLFAVGLSLQAALARDESGPAGERMRLAIDDIDETIRDIRSAIFALHTQRPGSASVRADVMTVARDAARVLGFEPTITFDGPIDSAATDAMHEHLVATLREALSNVAQHAHATRVEITVNVEQNSLVLAIGDNGRGVGEAPVAGNGLANMRHRAESLGGRCEVSAPTAGGTRLEWRVPISR
jgi:two-component system sensor histidine kinase DevS